MILFYFLLSVVIIIFKKFSKRGIKKFTLAKILIVSDVSATTVALFSKDKKYKCLIVSCTVTLNIIFAEEGNSCG